MRPSRFHGFYLFLIWLGSAVPPIVIRFWPYAQVFTYKGNEEVGQLISDACLAFFSAFPFWFVIETFQSRKKRRETARIQRLFIDTCISDFNRYTGVMLIDKAQRAQYPDRDYAYKMTDKAFLRSAQDYVDSFMSQARTLTIDEAREAKRTYAQIIIKQLMTQSQSIENRLAWLEPYRSSFSMWFNTEVQSLRTTLWDWKEKMTEMPDDDYAPLTYSNIYRYTLVRRHLVNLENLYREEHNLGPEAPYPESED